MTLRRITILLLVSALAMSSAWAASTVRVMPDRQVRPGVSLPVWGNAGNAGGVGDGSANGEAYTWSFSANANVGVADDGNLSGTVGNDRYVVENVTFTLLNGSTREIITATLDVGGTIDTVEIDIVDVTDVISNTPQTKLAVDVNIAIQDGLRFVYLSQQGNGSWTSNFSGDPAYTVSHTGLCAWAFENSGHAPNQNTVYSPFVQQALDYLLNKGQVVDISGKAGRNFHSHLAGTTGINPVGPNYPAAGGDFDENYAGPISAAAIIASLTPNAVVGVGPAAGLTYKQWIEEYTDWSNYGQARGYGNNDPEGGWYYYAGVDQNDHSVNSWMYLALEGAETVFGATFDPAIKDSVDTALVNRQEDTLADPGFGRFGYYGKTGVSDVPAYNTTCAGLSGLALEQLPGNKSVGTPAYPGTGNPPAAVNLDSYTEKRDAALAHLGRWWAVNPSGFTWLNGNHGNHYSMFACCRGLRLNKVTTLTNDGTYGGDVGPFNWETNITAPGAVTEGYWPFLVRTQNANGSWDPLPGSFPYDADWDTCSAIFCLQPTVFGPPRQGPQFVPARIACGASVVVEANSALSFDINASDADAGDTVTLDVMNLPAGATMTPPLPTAGNPVSSTFDWTPGDGDIGNYLITFKATDDDQNEATCDIEIEVGEGGPLLVELASFEVIPGDGEITVNWETALEIDNQGFYVWRRDMLSNATENVSGFIAATAVNNSGASYSFTDRTAPNGVEYVYYLEDIDLSGKSTTHTGVRAIANPQNPSILLLSPAYGTMVQSTEPLVLRFEAAGSGPHTVAVSADPTFQNPALMLRARGDQAVIRASLLGKLAATSNATLYWGVLDHKGDLASQVWRFGVNPYQKNDAVAPLRDAPGLAEKPSRKGRIR